MPVLTPAELWQATGRYDIPEVFKLKDRNGREFVLPMTHEETVAFHAREIQSYRELPQMLYHFQTKERDEPRPRAGLIRVREFIMKDSYSFDRDEEGLDKSFRLHADAYDRIFERCGLEVYPVQAESGMMGGSESRDYLAPSEAGENTLVTCENCDYAADQEIAHGVPRAPDFPEQLSSPEEVETPNVGTIEGVASLLGVDEAATAKAMPVVVDGRPVLALVRGDDRLDEAKLVAVVGAAVRPAQPDEIRETFGADGGSIGPVGTKVEIVADETLREGQFVAGANRTGWHLRGVQAGTGLRRTVRRHPRDSRGRHVPEVRRRVAPAVGDRGRTHLQAGNPLFRTARRDLPRRGRPGEAAHHGELRNRPGQDDGGRHRAAPRRARDQVAGRRLAVRRPRRGLARPRGTGGAGGSTLEQAGDDVLLDDRDQRAGEKFADADLIGIPVRVTVGKKTLDDNAVDVRDRGTGEERRVVIDELGSLR